MKTATITTTALVLALSLNGDVLTPGPDDTAEPEPTVIAIEAPTKDYAEHVRWALRRLNRVGIELPTMTIVFHDNYEACGMRQGVLHIVGDEITLHECERLPHDIRRSLLHELVHAWDYGTDSLTPDAREDFLRLRDLEAWEGTHLDWNARGAEHAAEIVAWGLMEARIRIPSSVWHVGSNDTDTLSEAYRLLVGGDPLWLGGGAENTVRLIPRGGSETA
jgi:hypothetical protein